MKYEIYVNFRRVSLVAPADIWYNVLKCGICLSPIENGGVCIDVEFSSGGTPDPPEHRKYCPDLFGNRGQAPHRQTHGV